MKKLTLIIALFAFIGITQIQASATEGSSIKVEKRDDDKKCCKKGKKGKRGKKACATEASKKACAEGEKKSCCKAKAEAPKTNEAPSAPTTPKTE